ncbi:hypothetical protein [Amycolatopsis sulphurea]|uniref:hypothetical protein n=1 Tax=Amycolatopsis sulphurea TaxID=76022 RepID=UPI001145943E|nr:hypothetical protein [Amycolatopsis sulphurea]
MDADVRITCIGRPPEEHLSARSRLLEPLDGYIHNAFSEDQRGATVEAMLVSPPTWTSTRSAPRMLSA